MTQQQTPRPAPNQMPAEPQPKRSRLWLWIALSALIALTAGLIIWNWPTASEPASSPPSATAQRTESVSTTPAPLTREQAGQKYLAATAPVNAMFDKPECAAAEDYLVNGGSWDRSKYGNRHADQVLRACYRQMIPLYTTQIQVLQTTAWPVDAKQDMADLISLDQGFLHWLKQAVKGTTAAQMYAALQSVPPDDGSPDRVRARFGLPGRSS